MSVKSKKYSTKNFYCESGIDLSNISQWFKEELVFDYLPDGIYYGKTGTVELKEGKNGLRLIVNVLLKQIKTIVIVLIPIVIKCLLNDIKCSLINQLLIL